MSASDLVERPTPGRAVDKRRSAMRGIRLKLSAPGRFAAIRTEAIGALLWAGVPALVAALYLYVFAADQYQAEAKFVVRGDTIAVGAESGGTLGDIIEINTSQDTRIAADFIASGAAIADLKTALDLGQMFTAPGLDLFAGLPQGATGETLTDYWRHMVQTEVDAVSGIVTLHAKAFSAEDAQALAAAVIPVAEAKLNALHRLALDGAARVAAERAKVAAERLKLARTEIKVFRERYRAIDLNSGASSTFELLSSLRRQRIEDRAELAVQRAQGAGNSPVVKALEARIAATDKQIVALEKELTGAMAGDAEAASAAIESFDRLVLRQDMATQDVARAEAALARAERRLDKRQIYLEVFVPPAPPEESEFPRRARSVLEIFAVALALWALARLFWAGIRSHEV